MSIAPLNSMTPDEVKEYVDSLETQVRELTKRTNNRKKFTLPEVRRMRLLWDNGRGKWSQAELAEAFMCNPATVSRIVRGEYFRET